MKKILAAVLLAVAVFLVANCSSVEETTKEGYAEDMGKINPKKVDEIIITSGAESAVGRITDKDVIKELAKKAEELEFELDMEAAMTMSEMYTVKFMHDDKSTHQLSLDSAGVYWYDETPGCYHVTAGDLDYEYVKGLYEKYYVPDESASASE